MYIIVNIMFTIMNILYILINKMLIKNYNHALTGPT